MQNTLVYNDDDTRFYVAQSTIPDAGLGLFSRQQLRNGNRLEVIGPRVLSGSLNDLCTQFADEYKIRAGDEYLIIPCGLAGMINHSIEPNMVKVIEKEKVFLTLIQDIDADKELFYTYANYACKRFL